MSFLLPLEVATAAVITGHYHDSSDDDIESNGDAYSNDDVRDYSDGKTGEGL